MPAHHALGHSRCTFAERDDNHECCENKTTFTPNCVVGERPRRVGAVHGRHSRLHAISSTCRLAGPLPGTNFEKKTKNMRSVSTIHLVGRHRALSLGRTVPNFEAAIGNTPLIRLREPSRLTGCEIYGKCEFSNPGGSVKDRVRLPAFECRASGNYGIVAPALTCS